MTVYLRHFHVLLGLLLIGLGVWTFINLEILAYYKISLDDPEARVAIRAIIGGGEMGLGSILCFGTILGINRNSLYYFAGSVFCSVGLARIGAILVETGSALEWQPWRESSVELILGALAVVAGKRSSISNS